MRNLVGRVGVEPTAADEESRRTPHSEHPGRSILNKRGRIVMAQLIIDHLTSGCFGTSLAPRLLLLLRLTALDFGCFGRCSLSPTPGPPGDTVTAAKILRKIKHCKESLDAEH